MLVVGVKDKLLRGDCVKVRDRFLENAQMHGDPAKVPAEFYVYHWAPAFCKKAVRFNSANTISLKQWVCRNYTKLLSTFHDLVANRSVTKTFPLDLFAWGQALMKGAGSMQHIQNLNQKTYDAVLVARDDHVMNHHIQLPAYNVSKVHAGFNAVVSVWIPSVLILPFSAVAKLAAAVEANFWPALGSQNRSSQRIEVVMEWIENVTGMPVVRLAALVRGTYGLPASASQRWQHGPNGSVSQSWNHSGALKKKG